MIDCEKIDCRSFRERKLADPLCADEAVRMHASLCPPCARYAQKLEAFERELRCCATAACEVPKDLAANIVSACCGTSRAAGRVAALVAQLRGVGTRSWFAPTMGALAMTLVLGVAGLIALNVSSRPDPMASVVIAHVLSEPGVFEAREDVPVAAVQAAFAGVGGRLQGVIGEVRYLGTCVVNGHVAQHLLVQTPEGEATLILVPGKALEQGLHSEQGMTSTFVPLGRGSVGIVTRSEDTARKVHERIVRAVRVEG